MTDRDILAAVDDGVLLPLLGGDRKKLEARLVSAMLFGIQPGDPGLIISCAAALFAVGIAAALVPASKACQVDPVIALRHE